MTTTTNEPMHRAERAERAPRRRPRWRSRAAVNRPRLARAERCIDRAAVIRAALAVVEGTGVDMQAMLSRRGRGRPKKRPSQARKLALYLTAIVLDVPIGRLARSARVGHQDVSRWLHQIEDRRDDPAYDAFVARLEGQLQRSMLLDGGVTP